jgi:hypothetical protein
LDVRQPAPGSRWYVLKLLAGVAFGWFGVVRLSTSDSIGLLDGLIIGAALVAYLLAFLDPNRKRLDSVFEERMSRQVDNPSPQWQRLHRLHRLRKTWMMPLGVGLGGAVVLAMASAPQLATFLLGGDHPESNDPLFRAVLATLGLISLAVAAVLGIRA